jgi:hypothetical protein
VNGWPFLVARGRRVGYRTVLAPDFLVQARQHHLLADHVGGEPPGSGGDSVVEVRSTDHGPLVVTYREESAPAAELVPGSDPDTLRDRHGRPLELLYGVVTGSPAAPVERRELDVARTAAIEAYRRFLADEEGAEVQAAPGFAMDAVPPQPSRPPAPSIARSDGPIPPRPRTLELPAPPPRPRRAWIVVAVALVVVVAAVLLGGRFIGGGGGLTVDLLDPPGGECAAVVGHITADPPGQVKHWWHVDRERGDEREVVTVPGGVSVPLGPLQLTGGEVTVQLEAKVDSETVLSDVVACR